MYKTNHQTYVQTARFWTESFAQARAENSEVVKRVCEMGFSEDDARKALEANGWDEMASINALLSK